MSVDFQRTEAKRIGQRLAWARKAQNMTRQQLANAVGVDHSMIRYMELGQRVPSVFLAMSLMHVLQISPQYLLWGEMLRVEPGLAARLTHLHPEFQRPLSTPYGATPFPGKTGRSRARNDTRQRRIA